MGRAKFFLDRSGPSQNLGSQNPDRAGPSQNTFSKIRTELVRAKKKPDRAGPSQNVKSIISIFTVKCHSIKNICTSFLHMGGAGVNLPTSKIEDIFSYVFDIKFTYLQQKIYMKSNIFWLVISSRAERAIRFWTGLVRANFHEPKPSQN